MKARSVIFFAESGQIPEVKRRILDEVLPRFSDAPQFLGFVALQSSGSRPEVVAMSFWDDGLEGSEAIAEEFQDVIERVTGAVLARMEFAVVKMMMRHSSGEVLLDVTMSDDADHRCPKGHRLIDDPVTAGREPTAALFCPTCNAKYAERPDGSFRKVSDRPGH